MSRRFVLCGDIGGTKTLLAIAALAGERLELVLERRYADRDFAAFADLVRAFRDEARIISPRLLPRLRSGPFLEAFNAKGVHANLAARFPVKVVVNERLGLLGAAKLAVGS